MIGEQAAERAAERLVRRFFDEVIGRRRVGVAREVFAPDVVDHQPEGAVRGVEALTAGLERFLDRLPDLVVTVHAVAVAPPLALAWFTWRGARLRGEGVDVFRAEGGRLVERWGYVAPRESRRPEDRPLLRIRW